LSKKYFYKDQGNKNKFLDKVDQKNLSIKGISIKYIHGYKKNSLISGMKNFSAVFM